MTTEFKKGWIGKDSAGYDCEIVADDLYGECPLLVIAKRPGYYPDARRYRRDGYAYNFSNLVHNPDPCVWINVYETPDDHLWAEGTYKSKEEAASETVGSISRVVGRLRVPLERRWDE